MSAFKDIPSQIAEGFKEAKLGLRSPDAPTRRMAVVFYLSLVGLLIVGVGFGKMIFDRGAKERAKNLAFDKKQKEDFEKAQEAKKALEPPPYQSIGTFSLEIREQEGVAKTSGLRAAEMEIVVACSSVAVCEWIKSHIDLSRGSLGSLFTPTDRERILSTSGKRAFREEVREMLNKLLDERGVKGSVVEVLFPRFIVS